MLNISTPKYYISEPGAIKSLGRIVKEIIDARRYSFGLEAEEKVRKAFVVASPTAWEKAGNSIAEQLKEADTDYERVEFKGYPSERQAREYAASAREYGAELLIAVGGGRTLDVTKAAGTFAGLQVVTVPTIAATCAAWAAVSILYTDEGDFDKPLPNPVSPKGIIADTDIIAAAPSRYIKAGIADTLAKWYEPVYASKENYTTKISKHGAKLAYDVIVEKSVKVLENIDKGVVDEDTIEIIDAIIYLAGFVGSFIGERAFGGFAHPFYHSSRRIPSTRKTLHGELVAFGMVAQLIFEKRDDELDGLTDILGKLDSLHTLEDIGLTECEDKLVIAKRILDEQQGCVAQGHSAEEIVEAFDKAGELNTRITSKKTA
ncbi:glycerol dehydrogenase [Eubacterium ruminantium]|nr:glycerol dehydrogenase [Eubacterium ruminantium]